MQISFFIAFDAQFPVLLAKGIEFFIRHILGQILNFQIDNAAFYDDAHSVVIEYLK